MYRLVGMHAQDDDVRRTLRLLKARRHLEPIELRHSDVDNGDVRLVLLAQLYRLQAIGGFRHDRLIEGRFEKALQSTPHNPVVVSQQHSQGTSPQ